MPKVQVAIWFWRETGGNYFVFPRLNVFADFFANKICSYVYVISINGICGHVTIF
jgi:hypothetical protein